MVTRHGTWCLLLTLLLGGPARAEEPATLTLTCTPAAPLVGEVATLTYVLTCAPGVQAAQSAIEPPDGALRRGPPQQAGVRLPTGAEQHRLWWRIVFPSAGTWRVAGTQELALPTGNRVGMPAGPLTITVMPLPPGAPPGGPPVIGPVDITATLTPARIRADRGARWTVRVHGGDTAALPVPRLLLPPGLQAYALPQTAGTDADDARVWQWDLLPPGPGVYPIRVAPLVVYARGLGYRLEAPPVTDLRVDPEPGSAAIVPVQGPPAPQRVATPVTDAWATPSSTAAAALGGLLLGAPLRVLVPRWRRWRARTRPRQHLLRALARDDMQAAAGALAALRRRLAPGAQVAADELAELIDRRRFGGETLPARARDLAVSLRSAR